MAGETARLDLQELPIADRRLVQPALLLVEDREAQERLRVRLVQRDDALEQRNRRRLVAAPLLDKR